MTWFASFLPVSTSVSFMERLRGSIGALLGIGLTGLLCTLALGGSLATPMLIAPMGASAVLLFAVPSSPLAQPWSIIGGNLVAALVGVSAARLLPGSLIAAPAAISVAIALMLTLRCLHPPSGAVALTAVLGGPAVVAMGYRFVLWPVLLNTAVITLVAIGYNNATRRRYPYPQNAPSDWKDTDTRPGFSTADLDAVLSRYDQVLDVSRLDIEVLLREAEGQAYRRRFGVITCGEIMTAGTPSVEWGTPLDEAWRILRDRNLRSVPVVDRARHVVGIVRDRDFLAHAGLDGHTTLRSRFLRFLAAPTSDYGDGHEAVGQIMSKTVRTATDTSHIVTLVPLLADPELDHVPIVDADDHLVGTVAPADLISALYQSRFSDP